MGLRISGVIIDDRVTRQDRLSHEMARHRSPWHCGRRIPQLLLFRRFWIAMGKGARERSAYNPHDGLRSILFNVRVGGAYFRDLCFVPERMS